MSRIPLQAKSSKLSAASFGLVEVIVGVSILTICIGALYGVVVASQKIGSDATTKIQAAHLLEEGAEAARYMRKADWSTLQAHGNGASEIKKCLIFSNNAYSLIDAQIPWPQCPQLPTSPNLPVYVRTISLRCVYRTANLISSFAGCNIGGSGHDTGTIKATIIVSWIGRDNQTKSEKLETIVTNR